MKYKLHTFENNKTLVFTKSLKKGDQVRVYFTREGEGAKQEDCPVGFRILKEATNTFLLPDNMAILHVEVKRNRFFGLFGSNWQVVECEADLHYSFPQEDF